jgi:predicted metal-dependent hydrolase
MWQLFKRKIRRKRPVRKNTRSVTKHYLENRETARKLVLAKLDYFNQFYGFKWQRVAIRNQRRCWGSCSALKNLNFNYKIQFLPPQLQDYIIVHELCHLQELNHGQSFWTLVERVIPDYKQKVLELRAIDKGGNSIQHLLKVQANYLSQPRLAISVSDREEEADNCEVCQSEYICQCQAG